jgi:hypothetical protein
MVPAATLRLFDGYAPEDLPLNQDFVIERLLESGDRDDLRALTSAVDEQRLGDWLERRGARRLSSRSRRFWQLVLGVELAPFPESNVWNH